MDISSSSSILTTSKSLFGEVNLSTIIIALISGSLGSIIVVLIDLYWKNTARRAEKSEKVLTLLSNYEIIRLNQYFGHVIRQRFRTYALTYPKGLDLETKKIELEEDLQIQQNLDKANSELRMASSIVHLWMPEDINKIMNKLILKIDELKDEGVNLLTNSDFAVPIESIEQLKGGKEYRKLYNDLVKRLKRWTNYDN